MTMRRSGRLQGNFGPVYQSALMSGCSLLAVGLVLVAVGDVAAVAVTGAVVMVLGLALLVGSVHLGVFARRGLCVVRGLFKSNGVDLSRVVGVQTEVARVGVMRVERVVIIDSNGNHLHANAFSWYAMAALYGISSERASRRITPTLEEIARALNTEVLQRT
jgi:hypothetical protein